MRQFTAAARLLAASACLGWEAVAASASASTTAPAWPKRTFLSEPSLHPLVVKTNVTGQRSDGYMFLATDGSSNQAYGGPLIVDSNGDEVWISKGHAFNFGAQTYRDEPVLTWWNGSVFPEPVGRGYGNVLIADRSYQIIANVSLGGNFKALNASQTFGSNIDLHEIFITDRNTVVVTANNVTTANLKSVGGSEEGWVVDGQVYEIDIATNKVLHSWNSLDHLDQLPFTDSVYPLGSEGYTGVNESVAWGYFHINAASPFEDGYLISSRYFCSILAIDKDGRVKWRVQGRDGGDFHLASDAQFCFQHDARHIETRGSEIYLSLHDNANSPLTEPDPTTPTSGLLLKLDLATKTATRVERFLNPKNILYATAQGSYQGLSDGHVLVGHGFVPEVEEFAADGRIIATSQFGFVADGQPVPLGGTLSYRAFKSAWTGCPNVPPAVATQRKSNDVTVAMSWNGATDIVGWKVYAGETKNSLRLVNYVSKQGFETTTSMKDTKYVQVEAVGGYECGSRAPRVSKVIAVEGEAC